MNDAAAFAFHDLAPGEESFRDAVLAGLGRAAASRSRASSFTTRAAPALFEEICRLPEYYLTRTEIAILEEYAGEIAAQIGPHCPADRARQRRQPQGPHPAGGARRPGRLCAGRHLARASARRRGAARRRFPELPVVAVCADYTRPVPACRRCPARRASGSGSFPGSTIGNFEPEAVVALPRQLRRAARPRRRDADRRRPEEGPRDPRRRL